MTYYITLVDQTIQIIPRWQKNLSTEFLTDEEYAKEAALLALNGEFYIPLSKVKIDKIPSGVTIYFGTQEYSKLDDLVNDIYDSRSYSVSKESALKRIKSLVLKALLNNKKVYGSEVSYKFDFIDASNYEIII